MSETPTVPVRGAPFAEAVFVALDTLASIAPDPGRARSQRRVGFADLYRFALDGSVGMSPQLGDALKASPGLRGDLRHLLERTAPLHISARAAASSATVTTRQGSEFRMTLRESHADRSQIYVIIQFSESVGPAPSTLFVIDDERGCRKLPLPAASAGAVQLLLEADSELVAALRDPRTEVFMR